MTFESEIEIEQHVPDAVADQGAARVAAVHHLAAGGTVVYLEIDLDHLEKRLSDIDARGVVYAPGQSLADLYNERLPLYQRTADATVKACNATPDQLVARVIERLGKTK